VLGRVQPLGVILPQGMVMVKGIRLSCTSSCVVSPKEKEKEKEI